MSSGESIPRPQIPKVPPQTGRNPWLQLQYSFPSIYPESDAHMMSWTMLIASFIGWAIVAQLIGLFSGTKSNDRNDKRWLRWRNTMLSFLHAIECTAFCLILLVVCPQDVDRYLFYDYNAVGQLQVAATIAYVFYDTLDNFLNFPFMAKLDIYIHHAVMVFMFGTGLWWRRYIFLMSFGLAQEANSIFLHARMLMILRKQPPSSMRFKVIKFLNYASLVLIRFCLMCYIYYRILAEPEETIGPAYLKVMCGHGTFWIFLACNVGLLYRVIKADMNYHPEKEIAKAACEEAVHTNGNETTSSVNGFHHNNHSKTE